MTSMIRRAVTASVLAIGLVLAAQPASAQGFISPLIGFNFGGAARCLRLTDCDDKSLNYGVGFGVFGSIFGFEQEIAYAQDFFGESEDASSNVLTVMSNVMLAPNLKVLRPYALVGVGLIKSHVELTGASLLDVDNNAFGWNVGGGLIVSIAPHVALRGDIRYFHAFDEFELAGVEVPGDKLDFGRAAAAVVFTF
jgi:opacity protein-like surface antigen